MVARKGRHFDCHGFRSFQIDIGEIAQGIELFRLMRTWWDVMLSNSFSSCLHFISSHLEKVNFEQILVKIVEEE